MYKNTLRIICFKINLVLIADYAIVHGHIKQKYSVILRIQMLLDCASNCFHDLIKHLNIDAANTITFIL